MEPQVHTVKGKELLLTGYTLCDSSHMTPWEGKCEDRKRPVAARGQGGGGSTAGDQRLLGRCNHGVTTPSPLIDTHHCTSVQTHRACSTERTPQETRDSVSISVSLSAH